ncbi:unnamed protein product [Timema podura]|uniref:Carboxylesterase type B domain-containing protein n=1 Tax=Timema podura TaxID=61482 RepID=A0ABN7NI62_TIMPD|nr:unnamed protein product [Timema podura]
MKKRRKRKLYTLLMKHLYQQRNIPYQGRKLSYNSDPYTLVTSGNFNKVPYITGSNLLEGRFFAGSDDYKPASVATWSKTSHLKLTRLPMTGRSRFESQSAMNQSSYWEPINNDFERLVPLELGLTKGSQQSQEVANKIKQFYFDNETLSFSSRDRYIDLITDEMFVCGIHLTVKAQSASYDNIYNYKFTFNSKFPLSCFLYYLMYSLYHHSCSENFIQNPVSPCDSMLVSNIIPTVSMFLIPGNVPSPGDESVTWTQASSSYLYYLQINDTLTLQTDLEEKRMAFWEDIYKTFRFDEVSDYHIGRNGRVITDMDCVIENIIS